MFARKNTTLGLCSLSAEHLFHYLEDPYTPYFSQRFISRSKNRRSKHGLPAEPKQEVPEELFIPKG